MENDLFIAKLTKIWPELPALAGEQWASVEQPLLSLMADFRATTDVLERNRISYELLMLLESVPTLIERFDKEQESSGSAFNSQNELRGDFFSQISDRLGFKKQHKQTVTRFTDIAYPRRVWIQTRRISIVVRLNQHPSDMSDIPSKELALLEEIPVLIRMEAPDFEPLGPTMQEIVLHSDANNTPIVFDLAPRRIISSSIHLDFMQGGNHITSVVLPIEITENEVSSHSQPYTQTSVDTTEKVEPPDFTLYISCEPPSSPTILHFTLFQKGQQNFHETSRSLDRPLQDHTQAIYRRLTHLVSQIDPNTYTVLKVKKPISEDIVDEQLREEGLNLWQDLIPLELQERYEREREEWHNKSLLIISDEPDIPWELLWAHGDPNPLCLQMNLSRWLRRIPWQRTIKQPAQILHIQKVAVIAPRNPQLPLPFGSSEDTFLRALMHQYRLQDVSPSEATYSAVKEFLRNSSYDWVHVVTHGSFYPADPNGESALLLEDMRPLTPLSIIEEIVEAIQKQRPAFVFNACSVGRQGWAINGLGGWASRLIGAGAGLFLAPLWPVYDDTAYQFTMSVYQSMLGGKTIAEAVRQGRLEARRRGDPTWLAYSLYAHPNAILMAY